MKMTPEEFIDSTVEYYSTDPVNRRCVNDDGDCLYSPITADRLQSDGCAIGRHMTLEQQQKADSGGPVDVRLLKKN